MRVLIAPDSYKSSLHSTEVAEYIGQGLLRLEGIEAVTCPLADGGEGTGDIIVRYLHGEKVPARTVDTFGHPQDGWWIRWGRTAFVESSVGSPFIPMHKRRQSVWASTSQGTGRLAAQALQDPDINQVVVSLGGTGCVDGGIGFLQALGTKFYDAHNNILPPQARSLGKVERVVWPKLPKPLTGLYDTFVPLLGPQGAVSVYGPQKGISEDMKSAFESAMEHFARVLQGPISLANHLGSGAAGGLGFGILALGGELKPGAATIAEWMEFDKKIQQADIVITGEGQLDAQSLLGKVVGTVISACKDFSKPVLAVVGSYPLDLAPFYGAGLTGVLTLVPGPVTLDEAIQNAPRLLSLAGENIGRILKARDLPMTTKG